MLSILVGIAKGCAIGALIGLLLVALVWFDGPRRDSRETFRAWWARRPRWRSTEAASAEPWRKR